MEVVNTRQAGAGISAMEKPGHPYRTETRVPVGVNRAGATVGDVLAFATYQVWIQGSRFPWPK